MKNGAGPASLADSGAIGRLSSIQSIVSITLTGKKPIRCMTPWIAATTAQRIA